MSRNKKLISAAVIVLFALVCIISLVMIMLRALTETTTVDNITPDSYTTPTSDADPEETEPSEFERTYAQLKPAFFLNEVKTDAKYVFENGSAVGKLVKLDREGYYILTTSNSGRILYAYNSKGESAIFSNTGRLLVDTTVKFTSKNPDLQASLTADSRYFSHNDRYISYAVTWDKQDCHGSECRSDIASEEMIKQAGVSSAIVIVDLYTGKKTTANVSGNSGRIIRFTEDNKYVYFFNGTEDTPAVTLIELATAFAQPTFDLKNAITYPVEGKLDYNFHLTDINNGFATKIIAKAADLLEVKLQDGKYIATRTIIGGGINEFFIINRVGNKLYTTHSSYIDLSLRDREYYPNEFKLFAKLEEDHFILADIDSKLERRGFYSYTPSTKKLTKLEIDKKFFSK